MSQLLFGLSQEIWTGAILGAVIGAIVIPIVWGLISYFRSWWKYTRPQNQLFGQLRLQEEKCQVFVRDFLIDINSKLLSVEPRIGVGEVPNVNQLWADVDGKAAADVLNALGQVGKTRNISIVRMSQDTGQWNSHVIVIGGQSQKSFDFYRNFEKVEYSMDANQIYDNRDNPINREDGFGYGIILKARNPFKTEGDGIGFLIGGFGTLGTVAASHYFREHFKDLGKQFSSKYFGIVVRAPVTAGEEAVERLNQYDRVSDS